MAKRQLQLRELEITRLAAAEQATNDKHARTRYQAIRLYGQGWAIETIQEITQAGESTIRQWAMSYRAEGLNRLRSQWAGKNANKLTGEQREQIKQRLHQYRPVDLHLSTGNTGRSVTYGWRLSSGLGWSIKMKQAIKRCFAKVVLATNARPKCIVHVRVKRH